MSFLALRSPPVKNPLAYTAAAVAPSVTTNAASNINTTTTDGNGSVDSDGGSVITERGFVWSTSINPTTVNSKVIVAGTTGLYSGTLTSLSNNTLYHYRAYAINAIGTSYGEDTTFTTSSPFTNMIMLLGVG